MSEKSSTFAANFEKRMDLTACNLVKTMLKKKKDEAAKRRLFLLKIKR